MTNRDILIALKVVIGFLSTLGFTLIGTGIAVIFFGGTSVTATAMSLAISITVVGVVFVLITLLMQVIIEILIDKTNSS